MRDTRREVIMNRIKKELAAVVAGCVVFASGPSAFAAQQDPYTPPPMGQRAQRTSTDLEQLVAPIALYPDALVDPILAAAMRPEQVAQAEAWMQQHTGLDQEQLAREVDQQSWDPSVKALTQIPAVLANMDQNRSWTSALGEAYVNREQEVMNAIQVMRQRARQAGNLDSNAQQTVTTNQNEIAIAPVDPQIVYVPQYDPWLAYGAPLVAWPGWYGYPGLFWDGPGIGFGLGFGFGFGFGGFHGGGFHGGDFHGRGFHGGGFHGGGFHGGGFHGGGGGFHGGGGRHR
jgi:hypothetical protein